jgi:hypothetical protein
MNPEKNLVRAGNGLCAQANLWQHRILVKLFEEVQLADNTVQGETIGKYISEVLGFRVNTSEIIFCR